MRYSDDYFSEEDLTEYGKDEVSKSKTHVKRPEYLKRFLAPSEVKAGDENWAVARHRRISMLARGCLYDLGLLKKPFTVGEVTDLMDTLNREGVSDPEVYSVLDIFMEANAGLCYEKWTFPKEFGLAYLLRPAIIKTLLAKKKVFEIKTAHVPPDAKFTSSTPPKSVAHKETVPWEGFEGKSRDLRWLATHDPAVRNLVYRLREWVKSSPVQLTLYRTIRPATSGVVERAAEFYRYCSKCPDASFVKLMGSLVTEAMNKILDRPLEAWWAERFSVFQGVAMQGRPMLVLSGGEPPSAFESPFFPKAWVPSDFDRWTAEARLQFIKVSIERHHLNTLTNQ